jgi:microcystin-dependent protein
MSQLTDFFDSIRGVPLPYLGFTAPKGFLMCDGAAISRTTYSVLFGIVALQVTGNTTSGTNSITAVSANLTGKAAVGMPISGPGIPAGTTVTSVASNSIGMSANATATASGVAVVVAPFGVGDGSTTFNLPDMRGRTIAGCDAMSGVAAGRLTNSGTGNSGVNGSQIGATGGVDRYALAATHLPAHTHSGTTGSENATHTHGMTSIWDVTSGTSSMTGSGSSGFGPKQTAGQSTNHQHAFTTDSGTGGGQAHPIVQPTIIANYIVKY